MAHEVTLPTRHRQFHGCTIDRSDAIHCPAMVSAAVGRHPCPNAECCVAATGPPTRHTACTSCMTVHVPPAVRIGPERHVLHAQVLLELPTLAHQHAPSLTATRSPALASSIPATHQWSIPPIPPWCPSRPLSRPPLPMTPMHTTTGPRSSKTQQATATPLLPSRTPMPTSSSSHTSSHRSRCPATAA